MTSIRAGVPEYDVAVRRRRRVAIGLSVTLGSVVVAYLLVAVVLGRIYSVPSESMAPGYPPGSHVWATRFGSAKRGQVVIIQNPASSGSVLAIRRIVAVEGDTVSARDGRLRVNGVAVDEPYAQGPTAAIETSVKIPRDRVFLLGDNRGNSFDSRGYGARPIGEIVGFVRFGWGGG